MRQLILYAEQLYRILFLPNLFYLDLYLNLNFMNPKGNLGLLEKKAPMPLISASKYEEKFSFPCFSDAQSKFQYSTKQWWNKALQ